MSGQGVLVIRASRTRSFFRALVYGMRVLWSATARPNNNKDVSVMTRKPTIRGVCFQTVITSNILTNSSLRLYGLQVTKYY